MIRLALATLKRLSYREPYDYGEKQLMHPSNYISSLCVKVSFICANQHATEVDTDACHQTLLPPPPQKRKSSQYWVNTCMALLSEPNH